MISDRHTSVVMIAVMNTSHLWFAGSPWPSDWLKYPIEKRYEFDVFVTKFGSKSCNCVHLSWRASITRVRATDQIEWPWPAAVRPSVRYSVPCWPSRRITGSSRIVYGCALIVVFVGWVVLWELYIRKHKTCSDNLPFEAYAKATYAWPRALWSTLECFESPQ